MKIIIKVDFETDPQPPTLAIVPKPQKFIATLKVVSRYRIDVVAGKVGAKRIA